MTPQLVTIAVEGDLDAAVARRVLLAGGLSPGRVHGRGGKSRLDKALRGYNRAAFHARWLVLRDMDHDADCALELLASLLPRPAPWMCLRIVVRAIEAWLLADRTRIAQWLRVPLDAVPPSPEALADPKTTLIQLVRRSRRRALREAMVPAFGGPTRVGPGYTAATVDFVESVWQPQAAALNSPTLARCLKALETWLPVKTQ